MINMMDEQSYRHTLGMEGSEGRGRVMDYI